MQLSHISIVRHPYDSSWVLFVHQGNDEEILAKQQAAEKVLQEARAAAQKQIQEAKSEATSKSEKRLAEVKAVRCAIACPLEADTNICTSGHVEMLVRCMVASVVHVMGTLEEGWEESLARMPQY